MRWVLLCSIQPTKEEELFPDWCNVKTKKASVKNLPSI
jgi:hypothetical protein